MRSLHNKLLFIAQFTWFLQSKLIIAAVTDVVVTY